MCGQKQLSKQINQLIGNCQGTSNAFNSYFKTACFCPRTKKEKNPFLMPIFLLHFQNNLNIQPCRNQFVFNGIFNSVFKGYSSSFQREFSTLVLERKSFIFVCLYLGKFITQTWTQYASYTVCLAHQSRESTVLIMFTSVSQYAKKLMGYLPDLDFFQGLVLQKILLVIFE